MRSSTFLPAVQVSTALLATFASAALDARTSCHSGVYTLVARGTSEPQGGSVLEAIAGNITAAIPGSASNEVVYPANTSFYSSVPVGVANVQQQMQDYYSQCPDGKMVIMGYSQGAYVMSVALAGGEVNGDNFSPISTDIGKNIAAVVMFGDPSRVLNQGEAALGGGACNVSSPLVRTGSADSAMQFYAHELQDWCAAADPICCKTGNNIQAHLSYWGANTTDTAVKFVKAQVGSVSSSSSSSSSSTSPSSSSAPIKPSHTAEMADAATPSASASATKTSSQTSASTESTTIISGGKSSTTSASKTGASASASTAAYTGGSGRSTVSKIMSGVFVVSALAWVTL